MNTFDLGKDETVLRRCPFCEASEETLNLVETGRGFCAIHCNDCGCQGPTRRGAVGAFLSWNQRPFEENPSEFERMMK